jgi:hypothetical protein
MKAAGYFLVAMVLTEVATAIAIRVKYHRGPWKF